MKAELVLEIQKWLRRQLIAARQARKSIAEAVNDITENLEDFGMDKGFVSVEPLLIKPKLEGAKVVIGFYDPHYMEATITV